MVKAKKEKFNWEISKTTQRLLLAMVGIFAVLEIIIFIPGIESFVNGNFLSSSIIKNTLISLTNDNRQENNMPVLQENKLLSEAAQLKAEDMAEKGYFSHESPNGLAPWVWIQNVGYEYSYAGENLAINFYDSADVVSAWMKSPAHKRNVISGNYSEIGIGIAEGVYKGSRTTFIVQFFASPIKAKTNTGTGVNGIDSQNNKINSLISSSVADPIKKIGQKIASNIYKVAMYVVGLIMLVASLLLLLNFDKYQRRGLVLAYNIIFVGLAVFFFALSFMIFSQSKGTVAMTRDNISINREV